MGRKSEDKKRKFRMRKMVLGGAPRIKAVRVEGGTLYEGGVSYLGKEVPSELCQDFISCFEEDFFGEDIVGKFEAINKAGGGEDMMVRVREFLVDHNIQPRIENCQSILACSILYFRYSHGLP